MDENDYRQIKRPIKSTPIVVQNNDYQWGVISPAGEIIVPFGKYRWIDGFQKGLAKVIGYGDTTSRKLAIMVLGDNEEKDYVERQGLINEKGEEVVPLEYTIWKFYGKDFSTIRASQKGRKYEIRYGRPWPIPIYSRIARYEEDDYDYREDSWDAMTDGQYGDMPDGFDGDYSFLGY